MAAKAMIILETGGCACFDNNNNTNAGGEAPPRELRRWGVLHPGRAQVAPIHRRGVESGGLPDSPPQKGKKGVPYGGGSPGRSWRFGVMLRSSSRRQQMMLWALRTACR